MHACSLYKAFKGTVVNRTWQYINEEYLRGWTKSVHQNLLEKTLPVTLKHILFNLKYFHFSLIMLAVYWLYGD